MKAVVREWGSMILKENVPIPVAGGSDVLILIKAAAINPVDYKLPSLVLGLVIDSRSLYINPKKSISDIEL